MAPCRQGLARAEAVRARIGELKAEWRRGLELTNDEVLLETERTRWSFQDKPFADIVSWLNVELAKNVAELGYVRFLYAARHG